MKWTETKGRKPRSGETPLWVRFRNGQTSDEALPAAKWNWDDWDSDWDIVAVSKG